MATTQQPTEQPAEAALNVAVDETVAANADDNDSTYESDLASYTTSLASNVTDYKFHNGRRYHSYKEGTYIFPNDEAELDRLDVVHKSITVLMRDELHFSPLKDPKRILDIGTGTGIWAMEIGDKFPNADVLGNDLSPVQPRWVPPNVHFEIDDVEADWTYSQKFDFIHCRTMSTAIRDWPGLVQKAFDNLNPGGYAEFIDYDGVYTSPDGTFKSDSDIAKLNRFFIETAEKNGMDASPGPKFENWFREAGYEDIKAVRLPMPFGTWPADRRLKEAGAWNYLMLNEGIEGVINYLFGQMAGMDDNELKVVAAKVRKQLNDPKVHCMYHVHVVYGRKPAESRPAEEDATQAAEPVEASGSS